jgi:hypothetical protein
MEKRTDERFNQVDQRLGGMETTLQQILKQLQQNSVPPQQPLPALPTVSQTLPTQEKEGE